MSSFNNLFNRMETLNEAKTSPYAAAHSSFGGVTKQMRAGGLSSAPLDTIKFIREILFNLDVISEEELQTVKSAKGFTGKKQAMLAVLRANQEAINAKTDEIAKTVESTLDDFIGGMGVNRSREEKYAAQAASQEMAAEIRKAKSGKEMDDALTDIVSDEKLLVKASLAKAIQELEDLPAGEDLSTEIVDNIKGFAPKIDTIEQFEALVKQMGEMEEYQIPAYHLSGTVKALKGGLEDIEMEDQEDPDEDGEHGSVEEHYPEEQDPKQPLEPEDAEGSIKQEVLNACQERADESYPGTKNAGMAQACQEMHKEYTQMYEEYGEDGDQEKAEIFQKKMEIANNLAQYFATQSKFDAREDGEHAEGTAKFTLQGVGGMHGQSTAGDSQSFNSLEEVCAAAGIDPSECANAELWDDMGDGTHEFQVDEDNVIIMRAHAEDDETVTESRYTTADYITDVYANVKPIVESVTVNENGQTTPTLKYLAEKREEAIEEVYTSQYLTEQKASDSYIKSKPEQGQTFKERYKPKTSYQLEELRRYGL